jgi:hypothetical protein
MAVDKEEASYFKINKYSKIFGVLLATISILLFFCICSYLFSFKQDQSIAIEGWEQIKNTESYKIKNWVNKIGLYFGYVFADVLFGVFSLLIPMSLRKSAFWRPAIATVSWSSTTTARRLPNL